MLFKAQLGEPFLENLIIFLQFFHLLFWQSPHFLDGLIRANRLILANRFRVPELNPFFANHASRGGGGGLKIANRRFEAIRANRSNVMIIGIFSANRFA